jgi:hypothetical protein
MIQFIECEQGTDAWYAARLGIPTASCFATVMAKGKDGGASNTRTEYMHKLAGEILTQRPMESYSNGHMERGKEWEPDARNMYAFMRDCEPQLVGFIRNGQKGCSPDSLLGNDGGLEIKSAAAHIQVKRLLANKLPAEHRAQVQGNIWVAEREWWDFTSYCPGLPLLIVREYRDDEYIAKCEAAIDQFNDELAEMVERVRRLGGEGPSLGNTLNASLEAA